MDSTSSSAQIAVPRDAVPLTAPDRWTGVENALSRLAERAARETPARPTRTEEAQGADVAAALQAADPPALAMAPSVSMASQTAEPSVLATVRPAEFRNAPLASDPLASERPSRRSRAARAFTRFAIAVCVGVAGSLAWQSYGSAAREMIASRMPRLAWISLRSPAEQNSAPEPAASVPALATAAAAPATAAQAPAGTPQPTASQAAPMAQTAVTQTPASSAAAAMPAPPSPDRQQLDGMAREIGALHQEIEHLTARQEQMARDLAKLRAAKASSHRVLGTPPHPLGVLVNRPTMAPPAAPQVSAAVPPTQSYPQLAPQMSPQPAPPPQSVVTSESLRPPVPVPGR